MKRTSLSRRQFLHLAAGASAATLLVSCVPAAGPTATEGEASTAPAGEIEATLEIWA